MMPSSQRKQARWFIYLTFFIAIALEILPLPGWVNWFRPAWVVLALIYWVMALPNAVGVTFAFFLGLLLDLLTGSLLGEHAFAMVLITYLVIKLHKLIRVYPLIQQTMVVFGLLFIYTIIIFSIQGMSGRLPHSLLYWLSIFVGAFLWPWIFILLRDWRRRLEVS